MPHRHGTPPQTPEPVVGVRCKAAAWKSLRAEIGLDTDQALADRIGVSRSTVSRILTGTHDPSMDFAAQTLHTFRFATFEGLFELYVKAAR